MAADLEAVALRAHVVGVMDHPRREPQHLALQGAQRGESTDWLLYGCLTGGHGPQGSTAYSAACCERCGETLRRSSVQPVFTQ